MKKLLIALLALSFLRVDSILVPAYSSTYVSFDQKRNVFIDKTPTVEMWRFLYRNHPVWGKDPKTGKPITDPVEVPAKRKVVIKFRHDLLTDRRFRHATPALLMGAVMVHGSRNKSKFVLVNVEQTPDYDEQYRVWPHLGILSVGTAAYEEGWEVVLWDELVQGPASLEKLVEPGDVVGLSLIATGIERGTGLATEAKELGAAYVIAGNDSAIFRKNQILRQGNNQIDAVFTSNSLASVRQFFRELRSTGLSQMDIPGVAVRPNAHDYRLTQLELQHEARERSQDKKQGRMDKDDVFVVPKFDLFPDEYWQTIWNNYRAQFRHKHANPSSVCNGLALFAQGCTRAGGGDICRYCTIYGVNDIRIPETALLAQIVEAYQHFGIDYVFNVTDSCYEMTRLVQGLQEVNARFSGLLIYGRGWGVAKHPELLDQWQSLVSDRLLINSGFDSGDEEILRKGVVKVTLPDESLVEMNRQAVRRIKEGGAHLHYSLIFGSPGETRESCERSIEFMEWTCQVLGHQLDVCESDIWWLNHGSPCSRLFESYDYAKELAAIAGKEISLEDWYRDFARHAQGLVVPEEVERAWYHYFTHITYDHAQACNDRVVARMAHHTGSIRGRAFKPPLPS